MGNLTLDLNINSARNLANVNFITKMHVYTLITIHGDTTQNKQKVKTTTDRSGGSNPTWNHPTKFIVNERSARDDRLTLVITLMSRRLLGDKYIGGVNIPLLELFNSIIPSINNVSNNPEMKVMTYQVRNLLGKRSGCITFSYRFKLDSQIITNQNLVDHVDLPLTAAPSSQIEHLSSGPPELPIVFPKLSEPPYHLKHPFAAKSNNDPLPLSYGFTSTNLSRSSTYDNHGHIYNHMPPLQTHQKYVTNDYSSPSMLEYGYRSPPYQQQKRTEIGLGLGAGILGGLMIGDIVSDVANCFDL